MTAVQKEGVSLPFKRVLVSILGVRFRWDGFDGREFERGIGGIRRHPSGRRVIGWPQRPLRLTICISKPQVIAVFSWSKEVRLLQPIPH